MNAPHLAIVDDHEEIRELLERYLGEHGYRVSAASNAAAFRRLLGHETPDLVVLDILMPGEDGLQLCRTLRATHPALPIIFLTAMAEETDRIVGLEMGGDDYLPKPFNPRELLARIKAVLRRVAQSGAGERPVQVERYTFADKTLDLARREVTGPDGVAIALSHAEFRLLCIFLERPGVTLSRDELLDLTSGRGAEVWDRTIDNQVSRLRRKIEDDPSHPSLIRTCWGDGYQWAGKVHAS